MPLPIVAAGASPAGASTPRAGTANKVRRGNRQPEIRMDPRQAGPGQGEEKQGSQGNQDRYKEAWDRINRIRDSAKNKESNEDQQGQEQNQAQGGTEPTPGKMEQGLKEGMKHIIKVLWGSAVASFGATALPLNVIYPSRRLFKNIIPKPGEFISAMKMAGTPGTQAAAITKSKIPGILEIVLLAMIDIAYVVVIALAVVLIIALAMPCDFASWLGHSAWHEQLACKLGEVVLSPTSFIKLLILMAGI